MKLTLLSLVNVFKGVLGTPTALEVRESQRRQMIKNYLSFKLKIHI